MKSDALLFLEILVKNSTFFKAWEIKIEFMKFRFLKSSCLCFFLNWSNFKKSIKLLNFDLFRFISQHRGDIYDCFEGNLLNFRLFYPFKLQKIS